jgi:carboxymethylenebutenolidase
MPDIQVQGPDGSFSAYVAMPKATPAPALLVIQEIFGVNDVMRELCDQYAGRGYVAICPDLFWRIEPGVQLTDKTDAEWQKAFDLMGKFDPDKGVEDLQATLAHARGLQECNGKGGSVGYCLGGKLAFMMACRSDAECNVAYYGVGLDALLDEATHISRPLLMHVATEDKFVPKDAQAKIQEALKDHAFVTIFAYEGQNHAFAREGGEHYDPKAAELANERTLDFLKQHLS